jgi:peptide/nickel transport system permease protein
VGAGVTTALTVEPVAVRRRSARPVVLAAVRRLGAGMVVLWAAATAAFVILHSMPGNIADILAGQETSPELRAAIAADWGLDDPLIVQYGHWLGDLVRGDLGTSYVLRQPVTEVVGDQLPATILLAVVAMVLAVVLALVAAVTTAGRGRVARAVASALELVATSVPVFWLGILLLLVFSFTLPWFPVAGGEGVRSLVLPAVALALPTAGVLGQVLRESLEATLEQPFVLTARARGIGETLVRTRHALKHAAMPAITLSGWLIGSLLGGAVITETVFGRPGLGAVTLNAVTNKDVPVVLAVVLLAGVVYVVVSTLVDVVHLVLDPRGRQR